MNVAIEEIAMLLGQKDIEIFFLQKQLSEAKKQIEALKKTE